MDSWEEARRYSALDERDVRIKGLEQENAELRERLAWCTDRRAQLAKALGKDDEELPWEDVKLEISKWEELEIENAELRDRVEDLSNRLSDVIEKNTILTLELAGKRS